MTPDAPAAPEIRRPEPAAPAAAVPGWHRRAPGIVALLVAAVALLDLGSAVSPATQSRARLLDSVPGVLPDVARAGTLMAGVLLLLLAKALRRRKRRAWRGTVALLALSVGLHLLKGLDVEEAVVSVALLGVLAVTRSEFTAQGDPRTRWRAAVVGGALVVADVGLGIAALELLEGGLRGAHPLTRELRHVLLGLLGLPGPLEFARAAEQRRVAAALAGLGIATALTVVYLLLRPSEPAARLSPEDERRMRELLAAHGRRDSLGYFALRRDKSVIFSPSGKAAVAYRVVSGVMLASGDPLGDPEAWPGAITAFLDRAREYAWTPAVMGCGEQGGTIWARAGLSALELGDEAVVEIAAFSLGGRSMRNVRQAVARIERAGYSTDVRRLRDIPPAERLALREQAASWRGSETERGFSMALGRFGDVDDGDCVAVSAFSTDDSGHRRLRGFLHFVPWGPDGLSLDLMRRDRSADNGLNELLIVDALRAAPGLGITRVSLNFAVFRSALERGERLGAGPVLRAWRSILVFASRWFQIESLYRFNAKFNPEWVPRYVCFPTAADLPRIAVAALEAEAFLVWPAPSIRRLVGRRSSAGEVHA